MAARRFRQADQSERVDGGTTNRVALSTRRAVVAAVVFVVVRTRGSVVNIGQRCVRIQVLRLGPEGKDAEAHNNLLTSEVVRQAVHRIDEDYRRAVAVGIVTSDLIVEDRVIFRSVTTRADKVGEILTGIQRAASLPRKRAQQ